MGAAATGIAAPKPPPFYLKRSRLDESLRASLSSRLTYVVADAGFGKSTLLGAFAGRVNCAWYSLSQRDFAVASLARGIVAALRSRVLAFPPGVAASAAAESVAADEEPGRTKALAGLICSALEDQLTDLVVVFDNVEAVPPTAPSIALLEAFCRQVPSSVHVILASQLAPPFSIERLRREGHVVEIGAAELAFTPDEVSAVLQSLAGPSAVAYASELSELTDGWPAAVVVGAEALARTPTRDRSAVFDGLSGADLMASLAERTIATHEKAVRELVRVAAYLERFTGELCDAVGLGDSENTIRMLQSTGLVVEHRSVEPSFSLNALIARFVRDTLPLDPQDQRSLLSLAGCWFEEHDDPSLALGCARKAMDRDRATHVLIEHGEALVASGELESVIDAVRTLEISTDDPRLARVVGDAWTSRGDVDAALKAYETAAGSDGHVDPALAWRIESILVRQGDLERAARTFERAAITGTDPKEEALLYAMHAQAEYQRSAADGCHLHARRALELAQQSGDDRALAAAHTALAQAAILNGDIGTERDAWRTALEHAELVGYVPWIVRIRHNRVRTLFMEDAYEEALSELEIVLELSEAAGLKYEAAVALMSRAAVHHMRGALEEAVSDLGPAITHLEEISSPMAAFSLRALGTVQRERGNLVTAQDAYQRAVHIGEASGDDEERVLALAGLARVLSETDPEQAEVAMSRALADDRDVEDSYVQTSAALVALALGRIGEARTHAQSAARIADHEGDRASVAEALELLALTEADRAVAAERLHEALAAWEVIGAPIEHARTMLSLARSSIGAEARDLAERAERVLRSMGSRRRAADAAAFIRSLDREEQPEVRIRTLGGSVVERRGMRVPLSEWQSRKARDLLKILIARRGRPTSREQLMDLLWPDEDPAKASNRLSVALSTIRNVLDPDRRHAPDHYVAGDQSSVALEAVNLPIDVEEFLAKASRALELRREHPTEAIPLLVEAESAYAGDFLADDVYAEWAIPLREEARALYVDVTRALADEAALAAEEDAAVRHLLRILERDPFDERAHLDFIASLERAGRHGEARRAYRTYGSKMEEIGVEAAPFPPREARVDRSGPAALT